MDKFSNAPKQFNKTKISLRQEDFLEQAATTAALVTTASSNVTNTSWLTIHSFAVRPSGTEPRNQILHRYDW